MSQFVGRISLKHYDDSETVEIRAKEECLELASLLGLTSHCFVFEYGDIEREPHLHFYFESPKGSDTIRRGLLKVFKLPSKAYSLKRADTSKLPSYFVYLAKGVYGKHGDPVKCVLEDSPRMWSDMHEQYHKKAAEIELSRKSKLGSLAWYDDLADKCKALGKSSKEDILGEVVRYYVEDSKKGFDHFAVMRTFHAVFSRVNGQECKDFVYTACSERLFKW